MFITIDNRSGGFLDDPGSAGIAFGYMVLGFFSFNIYEKIFGEGDLDELYKNQIDTLMKLFDAFEKNKRPV